MIKLRVLELALERALIGAGCNVEPGDFGPELSAAQFSGIELGKVHERRIPIARIARELERDLS